MSQSERRAANPRRSRRTKAEIQAERDQFDLKKNEVVEDVEKPKRGRPKLKKFKEIETQGITDVAPTPYQQIYNELQDDMRMLKEKSFEDGMMITNLRNTVSSLKRISYLKKYLNMKLLFLISPNFTNSPYRNGENSG